MLKKDLKQRLRNRVIQGKRNEYLNKKEQL